MSTPTKLPWRKLLVTAGILAVVGPPCGIAVGNGLDEAEWERERGYRERCEPVPPEVRAAVTAGFDPAAVGDRTVRGWGAATSEDDGALWVSLELEAPEQALGTVGDIATFVAGPDGTYVAVDRHARAYTTWPPAADGVDVSRSGGVESRFCAMDVTRDPHDRDVRVDPATSEATEATSG